MRGAKPELGELDATVPADVAVAAVKGVFEAADAGDACSVLGISDIGGMGDAAERDHISVLPVTAVAVDVSAVTAGVVGEVSADRAADAGVPGVPRVPAAVAGDIVDDTISAVPVLDGDGRVPTDIELGKLCGVAISLTDGTTRDDDTADTVPTLDDGGAREGAGDVVSEKITGIVQTTTFNTI